MRYVVELKPSLPGIPAGEVIGVRSALEVDEPVDVALLRRELQAIAEDMVDVLEQAQRAGQPVIELREGTTDPREAKCL